MNGLASRERIHRGKLNDCIAAACRSMLDLDPGPDDPSDYATLLSDLERLGNFPGLYRELAIKPLQSALVQLGPESFAAMEALQQGHLLILDLAQALGQRHGNYHRHELMALQEVVSDLFDGFLSAEDRRGLQPPDRPIPAPLVKWGRPHMGPYTFAVDQMSALGVGCGVVSLPGAVARADGLFAWGALPHEACGHDIIACERGLLGQLATKIAGVLRSDLPSSAARLGLDERDWGPAMEPLIDHWVYTLEEAVSDVLGVLNMGPAAAVAILILMCGSADANHNTREQNLVADLLDRHPVPVLRIVLSSEVLRNAGFGAIEATKGWPNRLAELLDFEASDLVGSRKVIVSGQVVHQEFAFESARIVGRVIATARVAALGGVSLRSIQTWRDRDERIVGSLRGALADSEGANVQELMGSDYYAAHVVAAAILEALDRPDDIPRLHRNMVFLLTIMHEANPSWGPLATLYASDLSPRHAGAMPRSHGSGSGGIPRKLLELVGRRRGSGTGGHVRKFEEGFVEHQYGTLRPEILDGPRTGRAGKDKAAQNELPFPYPREKRPIKRDPA